jgi:hypothetical protein
VTEPVPSRALPPWRLADLAIVYVASFVGFALLAVAWWGASGTAKVSHQVPWVSVGAVALIVLGTGNVFWLLLGRRAVEERRRELLAPFAALAERDTAADATEVAVEPTRTAGPKPVAAPGMGHYHRASCQLVQGKGAKAATPAAHQRAGRQPCGMCQP